MQLPNADIAYVPLRKVTEYLLSDTHTVGRMKARFFQQVGFTKERAAELRKALIEIGQTGKITNVIATDYGTKYVVDGELHTPVGKRVSIRTIWIVERDQDKPRFVTAYPRKEE